MTASTFLNEVNNEFIFTDGYVKITTMRRYKQYLLCHKYDCDVSLYSEAEGRMLHIQAWILWCIAVAAVFRVLSRYYFNG